MNLATFQHALVADPTDALTWLALADWLEETGDGRAELVRLWLRLRGGEGDERRLRELVAAGHTLPLPEVTNGVGMRFVLVPPGTFVMGSPTHEKGRDESERQHRVTLTRPFWLGIGPVTQGQYRALRPYYRSESDGPDRPAEGVSADAADHFCSELGEIRDEIRAGRTYRLPTEAEWEYACRGAGVHAGAFSFGGVLTSDRANFDGTRPYGGIRKGVARGETTAIGSFRPNVLGLLDPHGNVWELCSDYYDEAAGADVTDPSGPASGFVRVMRGGSFVSPAHECRCASRGVWHPMRGTDVGFRLVLEWRGC